MKKLKNSELNRISLEEFKNSSKTPIKVVLDNIRSAHNVGSIFRTCDAFLIDEIILCGITAVPPNNEIRKTALGSTESLKWTYVCLLYTSPSPRDRTRSRMPSSA